MNPGIPSPRAVFFASCACVGATPLYFFFENPHTILALNVMLIPFFYVDYLWPIHDLSALSWQLVPMYASSMLLNVVLFALPALAVRGMFWKFSLPNVASLILIGWLAFYMLMLFVFFEPAHFP